MAKAVYSSSASFYAACFVGAPVDAGSLRPRRPVDVCGPAGRGVVAGAGKVGWNSTERQFCACGQDPCGRQEPTPARLNTLARRSMENVELRDSQETDQC